MLAVVLCVIDSPSQGVPRFAAKDATETLQAPHVPSKETFCNEKRALPRQQRDMDDVVQERDGETGSNRRPSCADAIKRGVKRVSIVEQYG